MAGCNEAKYIFLLAINRNSIPGAINADLESQALQKNRLYGKYAY